MQFHEFYKSVYAIMRIENGNGRLVGTASVISAKPVQLLTCHHVVSEANATNSAPVHYSITKRSDQGIDFDLRNASAAWLHVSAIALGIDVRSSQNFIRQQLLTKKDRSRGSTRRVWRTGTVGQL